MSEPNYAKDRPARYRAVVLQALAQLSGGHANAVALRDAFEKEHIPSPELGYASWFAGVKLTNL